MQSDSNYPKSDINSVGFPEGQLLANGAIADECAEISAAYLLGKPLPTTDKERVNSVVQRLSDMSSYGKHSDWGNDE